MIEFQNNKTTNSNIQKNNQDKPPYLLGLLGFIPLVGFFVGIGLTLYGLIKYKDIKLVIIGVFCMLFTVFVYSFMIFGLDKFDVVKEGHVKMAQLQINGLIKDIEFYKLENDNYPDSLEQLVNDESFVSIHDPIKGTNANGNDVFIYKNLGDKYLLFSVGLDGKPNTKDDIYPKIKPNSKIGWVKSE